jgi:serine/threonine protein phosphatase 1
MFKATAAATARRSVYPPLLSGETIFAIGDIHGRADLLDALHLEIDAALAQLGGPALEIYLGDYVDRGTRSAGVIERLVRRGRVRRTIMLRGNHEALFQQALDGALELREWARFGGLPTLESYGVHGTHWQNGGDWLARLRARIPVEHAMFLQSLSDSVLRGEYFFVHAGVRPGVPLRAQAPDDLYWIRRDFLDDQRDHGAVIVHGHTPTQEPDLRHNRINLDTGAFISGRLSCMRIDRDGARLFGGDAGLSAPILAPVGGESVRKFSLAAFDKGSLLARARRAGSSFICGWRFRKPEPAKVV